jgi:DNA-directed RNA polymerase I and III subunit RPAC1
VTTWRQVRGSGLGIWNVAGMSSEADRANLRFIKDYVTCHGIAPTHTSTYSRGTFPEDLPWDFNTWRDGFKIKILEIDENDMVFDMTGIDVSMANAFRRILLAEVPTMAIEKVFVHNNTGVLRDELVAQRLGMIPIKVDPSVFEWPGPDAKSADETTDLAALENQVLKFRLKVKCRKNSASGADNDPINGKVFWPRSHCLCDKARGR